MEPLISIIVPVYNGEKYIDKCIVSILNQTYQNLEIIVIDDGSTDGTGAILDQYRDIDKRVLIIHQKNSGVSNARNRGIELAQGEYLGFVDADDTIDLDTTELLLAMSVEYDADIAWCSFKEVYAKKVVEHQNSGDIVVYDHLKGVRDLLNGHIVGSLWARLYKRKLFENVRLNEKLKYGEDMLASYELFVNSNKSVCLHEPKYNYVQRDNSTINLRRSESLIKKIMKDRYFVATEIRKKAASTNEFYSASINFYLTTLISLYIIDNNYDDELSNQLIDFRKKIRKTLMNRIGYILKSRDIPAKFKIHAISALYFQPLYFAMRDVYRITAGKVPKS
jgi:glycosyltransferase involved in cell wall biosynthesis